MTQKSISFDEVAIATVERNAYRIHFWDMAEVVAVNGTKKC